MSIYNGCTACELQKTRTHIVQPEYIENTDIKIAIIGEAPGQEEDLLGKPFQGAAGQNLNEALQKANINRNSIFVGNIVACRPPNNRNPHKKEVQACIPKLYKTLQEIKPDVVVCLGVSASKAILKQPTVAIGKKRSQLFSGKTLLGFDCYIIVTWHPSPLTFASYPHRKAELIHDLAFARKHAYKEKDTTKTWQEFPVTSMKVWNKVYPIFAKSSFLVWDLETTGLDINAKDAQITNIGLCCDERFGVSIVCDPTLWTSEAEYQQVLSDTDKLIANPKIKKIAHNMKYDVKYYMKQRNIWQNNWFWDTGLAHSILSPEKGASTKLKIIASEYTTMAGYETDLDAFGGLLNSTPIDRVEYNIADCICTLKIAIKQFELLKKDADKERLFKHIIMPVAEVLAEIEYYGVNIDTYRLKELDQEYKRKIDQTIGEIYCTGVVSKYITTKGSFNPNSSDQKRTILFDPDYCGFPSVKETKTGNASTDKEVLETLAKGGSEICQLLLTYSELSKLRSTYIVGMGKQIINGKVYTTYNQASVISGRLASSSPNLQNIPSDSDIKSMFLPDKGHYILDADYKQLELALSTCYTKDPEMINALTKPVPGFDVVDAHLYIANKLFHLSPEIIKEKRTYIKGINFGVFYGMGNETLAKTLGISVEEAEKLIEEYFNLFKPTKIWIDNIKKTARTKGYVRSLFGRERFYPTEKNTYNGEYKFLPEHNSAVNHPIQGLASDIVLESMVRWRKYLIEQGIYGTKARIILTVHDSITTSVAEDIVADMIIQKRRVLENVQYDFLQVPLKVDMQIGKNWGNMQEIS